MEYRACLNCGFNVTPADRRCTDCGLLHPLKSLDVKRVNYSRAVRWWAGVGVGLLMLFFVYGSPNLSCCFIPGVIILIVVFQLSPNISNALTVFFEESAKDKITARKAAFPESLMYRENIINVRLSELSKREQQVRAVMDRTIQEGGEKWAEVRTILDDSARTLQKQRARYVAKSIEIEIVRLQNKLAPLIYVADRFSYDQIEAQFLALDLEYQDALRLGARLDEQTQMLGNEAELKDLAQRLTEIQASIVKLRDALIGQEAVLAVRDISPLEEALSPASRPLVALKDVDVFNTEVAITDFSESFDKLESEYHRVQSEQDVAQEIRKMINR